MSKFLVKINGMSCGHCVKHVEEALRENNKVDNFKVELGKAEIEGSISESEIKELIEDEGYDVEEITK